MQNSLINDINDYISYLNSKGLYVTVHGKLVGGLLEHNIHGNPYCSFVKTNDEAWNNCIKCQQKVFNAFNNDYRFGMCWAGVEEYVFYVDSKTFISVSGYGINKEKAEKRIKEFSNKYCFKKQEVLKIYEQGLKHEKEDEEKLKVLIKPLCHMISLLELMIGDVKNYDSKNKTFDSILAFVERNYMHDISIQHIAETCSCSKSTISHLFKEYTGSSVKKYINTLRLNQAEKLIKASDLPISNIALLCGFASINYFSSAFKNEFGISPTEYRKKV
jgi:AraC-like DNA-binding protein